MSQKIESIFCETCKNRYKEKCWCELSQNKGSSFDPIQTQGNSNIDRFNENHYKRKYEYDEYSQD